jgi:peptide/nickel transport system permease protein
VALLRALAHTLAVLIGVLTLVFLLLHAAPGDPLDVLLGESGTAADRERLARALGLDRSLPEQWARGLLELATGHWGQSLYSQRPVFDLIVERLPYTLELALGGALGGLLLALPLGLVAGLDAGGTLDRLLAVPVTLVLAMPTFLIASLLVWVGAVELALFPVAGHEAPGAWVLPVLTVSLVVAAPLARMLRASVAEAGTATHLRTARAKGLTSGRILVVHRLRPALLPVLALFGLQLGGLLGGAVITEACFAWPGLGSLLIEAIQRRDYPLVQGCVLVVSVAWLILNRVTDLLAAWVDPRLSA